jgi:phosphoenolpyruvate carboxykinase (GTP)
MPVLLPSIYYQACNWNDRVNTAAIMGSETITAAAGRLGDVRRDPFAAFRQIPHSRLLQPLVDLQAATIEPAAHISCELVQARPGGSKLRWERAYPKVDLKREPDWLEDFTRQAFNKLISVDPDLCQLAMFSHGELFVKLYDRLPEVLLFIGELIRFNLLRFPECWDLAPAYTWCDV